MQLEGESPFPASISIRYAWVSMICLGWRPLTSSSSFIAQVLVTGVLVEIDIMELSSRHRT